MGHQCAADHRTPCQEQGLPGLRLATDFSPAFDKDKAPYAYDPEKAKALLAEAGYADGFEFEVTASPNESWGVPIVEAILPMLRRSASP